MGVTGGDIATVPAWTPAVFEIVRENGVRGVGIPVAAK